MIELDMFYEKINLNINMVYIYQVSEEFTLLDYKCDNVFSVLSYPEFVELKYSITGTLQEIKVCFYTKKWIYTKRNAWL